jgi:hypothetical protein
LISTASSGRGDDDRNTWNHTKTVQEEGQLASLAQGGDALLLRLPARIRRSRTRLIRSVGTVGLSRKGFSILKENDQDARRAKEMAASARRRAVRWSLRLLADRANHQSHRSTLDDELRTPASEGSGADAEKVLADYSRPEPV